MALFLSIFLLRELRLCDVRSILQTFFNIRLNRLRNLTFADTFLDTIHIALTNAFFYTIMSPGVTFPDAFLNRAMRSTFRQILLNAFIDFGLLHFWLIQRVDHFIFLDGFLDFTRSRNLTLISDCFWLLHFTIFLGTKRIEMFRIIPNWKFTRMPLRSQVVQDLSILQFISENLQLKQYLWSTEWHFFS